MVINQKKTKAMIFNFTENYQFTTRLTLKDEIVEVIDSTRLLGTIITNDLKWDLNTANLVKKANARMELLRKVANFGAPLEDLKLYILSLLEVYLSNLLLFGIAVLQMKTSALRILLQQNFRGYKQALAQLGIESLAERREQLCLSFAQKCLKNDKMKSIFPINQRSHEMTTRFEEKFSVQYANTERLKNSAIIYMQNLLNKNELK